MNEDKKRNIIIRDIPDEVHRLLKSKVALEGKTIQGLIVELITQYVNLKNMGK